MLRPVCFLPSRRRLFVFSSVCLTFIFEYNLEVPTLSRYRPFRSFHIRSSIVRILKCTASRSTRLMLLSLISPRKREREREFAPTFFPQRDNLEKYSFVSIPLWTGLRRSLFRLFRRLRPDLQYLGIYVVVHVDRLHHFACVTDSLILCPLATVFPHPTPAAAAVVVVVVVAVAAVATATPMPASPFSTDRLISECTALDASCWDYRGSPPALRNRSFQSENRC